LTLLQGEEADLSCRSNRTPTVPVRSFCLVASASRWDIFTSVLIIHSLSFVWQGGSPVELPNASGLMAQLERKAERLCGPHYEDERAHAV
jgi:hypothetical protein